MNLFGFIQLENQEITRNLISSFLLILLTIFLRIITVRVIRSWKFPSLDAKRRLVFQTKNLFWLIFIAGLIVIWAQELRTIAISLVAVAAAIVVATKEIILCFLGGIYKLSTRPFEIGDKIEIAGFKGDVIDYSMLATTLFEIGPPGKGYQYTGKTLQLPNSMFLTQIITNDSLVKNYSLHTFSIPHSRKENWEMARDLLLNIANNHCQEYVEKTKSQLKKISLREGFDVPNVVPRISVNIVSSDTLEFLIRVPVPSAKKWHFEQQIKSEFLSQFKYEKNEIK